MRQRQNRRLRRAPAYRWPNDQPKRNSRAEIRRDVLGGINCVKRLTIEAARNADILAEAFARGANLKRQGSEWVGPCPVCGGHDRFAINPRKRIFVCWGAAGGDVISLVQHIESCSFTEACAHLTGEAAPTEIIRTAPLRVACAREAQGLQRTQARKLWLEGLDPRGSPVERYLESRTLRLPGEMGQVLRFHPALYLDGETVPGMMALFRDALNNAPCAIQRTFLSSDARKLTRKMLGPVKGAAIKLDGDADVATSLHIGEGIETCLAARALGFNPVWAVGSAGSIATFPVLRGIEALTILIETDDGGANVKAARQCAARWLDVDREVLTVTPQLSGDVNDVLREASI